MHFWRRSNPKMEFDATAASMVSSTAHQAEPSLDQRSGRVDEPHPQGSHRSAQSLRDPRAAPRARGRLPQHYNFSKRRRGLTPYEQAIARFGTLTPFLTPASGSPDKRPGRTSTVRDAQPGRRDPARRLDYRTPRSERMRNLRVPTVTSSSVAPVDELAEQFRFKRSLNYDRELRKPGEEETGLAPAASGIALGHRDTCIAT